VIRSAINYARCFAHCLGSAEERALLLAHRDRPRVTAHDRKDALRAAIGWLMRAQERSPDDGMGSYHLVHGWGASYPETTGYIIPTLLAAADHLALPEARKSAITAAEWLLTVQHTDGGWPGGRIGEGRPSIVFNSAQVIRGMLAAYHTTQRTEFLLAAVRAGDWIVQGQDADGAWRATNFLGVARVYDAYVSAPLLHVHAITGEARFRNAAERNVQWVLSQRTTNGWFSNCDNTVRHNDRPITHTLAYTIDGLLECDDYLKTGTITSQARVGSYVLLKRFLNEGWLNGRYDAQWNGSEDLITTGCAQLAITWARLAQSTGEAHYAEGLQRMTELLMCIQAAPVPADVRGGLTGSYPVWGRYENFAFPNWGTKYLADALLCAEGRLPLF
jgi:hypothetical protein